jgi:nitrogen regulatory protein PII
MSTEGTTVKPAVLLTIISESVMRDRIVKLLKNNNVTGYTISDVQGEGGHGRRMGDIAGYNTNIEIKTLVSPEASEDILRGLAEMREGHALIAFRQEVEALSD